MQVAELCSDNAEQRNELAQARSELALLWQAWLERVLAALLATNARSTQSQSAVLDKLQGLQRFLPLTQAPTLLLAEESPSQPGNGVPRLCELLKCQAQLRQRDADTEMPVMQPLQQGLLKVAQACRHSDWTLASCVASGLARQCRELTLLGGFLGNAALARQLAMLEAQLLLWHAAPEPPSVLQKAVIQKQLLALMRGREDVFRLLQLQTKPAAEPVSVLSADAEQHECEHLMALLQPALVTGAEVTETLMFACYRLAWILQALGRRSLAEAGLLSYHLLVRHWQQRAVLQAPVQMLLAAWMEQIVLQVAQQVATAALPDAALDLPLLLGEAIACWPGKTNGVVQSGPGRKDAGSPEILASSFSALVQVDAAWFADRSSWQRGVGLLQRELQLLEQGAAALRLSALEQFCSLLLGVHAQLHVSLPQGAWPGGLLLRAHRELVALLDRAALWLEPRPDADTLVALRDCLQQGEERCIALLRAPQDAAPELRLACSLALFGQQAGRLLGRPVRIQLDAPAAIQVDLEAELLRAVQEILRWLLLQHESSAELRRSQHLPLASTIAVTLLPQDDAACAVSVLETGSRGLSGGKQLQRLQRSLGVAVEALCCEDVPPLGRRIQCSLSLASVQRALDARYRGQRSASQN